MASSGRCARLWARRAITTSPPSELAAVADMKNQGFALHGLPPLDRAEVAGIVRSVYKRHQRKLHTGEQQRTFAFIQAARHGPPPERRPEAGKPAAQARHE